MRYYYRARLTPSANPPSLAALFQVKPFFANRIKPLIWLKKQKTLKDFVK